ncbi:hypothetical protein ABT324_00625 [Saccharopolyspora sp. NPDC000359]|uniref:hypothetical protein n=1 Tax=Saccharopolyspora sp. NPDC000359 TaxID=3154251 RepID=UPI0033231855
MVPVKLHRGLALVTVTGGLVAALAGNAGAAPRGYVDSAEIFPKDPAVREQLIDDCLRNPGVPAENEVLALNNAPGGRVNLLCGNEAFGARHIHAGHPINNSDAFTDCWLTTIATNNTRPGNDPNGSTEWHLAYAPGKEAVVVTADADRDTITAYTTGPNSADWEGCAAL